MARKSAPASPLIMIFFTPAHRDAFIGLCRKSQVKGSVHTDKDGAGTTRYTVTANVGDKKTKTKLSEDWAYQSAERE